MSTGTHRLTKRVQRALKRDRMRDVKRASRGVKRTEYRQ